MMGRASIIGKSFGTALVAALAPAVDLIFPPRCPLCGDAIAQQKGLCGGCWGELVIPGDPSCALCQRPFGSDSLDEGAVCAPCLKNPPNHAGIAAGTLYNDASRKLVLAFKHGRRIALAPMLAQLIAARLPEMDADGGDWVIVPVPLHRWRLWGRGFNQAVLLADEIGKLRQIPVLRSGLLRSKRTPSLGGLGRSARRRVLANSITVNPRAAGRIKDANILLIDDVLTSGATTDACVRCCLGAA